jgi:hypothetical protein
MNAAALEQPTISIHSQTQMELLMIDMLTLI